MACRKCGHGKPAVPFARPGLPTVVAWGPFPSTIDLDRETGLERVVEALANNTDS